MTQDQIIGMAREAGMSTHTDDRPYMEMLQRFAQLVRAAALEDAAQVCNSESYYEFLGSGNSEVRYGIAVCSDRIRQLKETK